MCSAKALSFQAEILKTPSRKRGRCESRGSLGYCGLRDAAAEAVPATSTEVPLVECSASTDPEPFAATEPLLVVAFKPPAPARFAEEAGFCAVDAVGAGFCAVAEADGAALELTLGLEACAWAAVPAAVLVAALVAVLVALEVAAFETAAVDSVEPATLAAPAVPVLETAAAD